MSKKISGIYIIRNVNNGKFYIGSSVNILKRWDDHKRNLKLNKHVNIHLQRAYNLDTKNSFCFEVLLECDRVACKQVEQTLLNTYTTLEWCYNIAKSSVAPMLGRKASSETKYKRSIALKGRTLSEEHKKKIGDANRGNIIGEDGRRNMSVAHIGYTHTEEQKKKISESMRGEKGPGCKLTEEQVLEIRELYSTGNYSTRQLAKMFNLKDKSTIGQIVKRKTWKHI